MVKTPKSSFDLDDDDALDLTAFKRPEKKPKQVSSVPTFDHSREGEGDPHAAARKNAVLAAHANGFDNRDPNVKIDRRTLRTTDRKRQKNIRMKDETAEFMTRETKRRKLEAEALLLEECFELYEGIGRDWISEEAERRGITIDALGRELRTLYENNHDIS